MHPDIDYYHWLETKKNTHKNSNKQRRRKKQQQLIIVARNSSIDDDNQLVFLLFLSSSLNKPVKQTSERMPCMQSLRSSFTCSFDVSFNLAFFLLSQRIWDFFCFGFGTCSGCSWRISCVSMCMDESLIHTSLLTKFFFVIYSVRFCLFFLLFLISASIKIVHVSVSFIWVVWTFSAFFLSLALDKIAWTRNFVVCINKYEWWLRCDHLRAVEKTFCSVVRSVVHSTVFPNTLLNIPKRTMKRTFHRLLFFIIIYSLFMCASIWYYFRCWFFEKTLVVFSSYFLLPWELSIFRVYFGVCIYLHISLCMMWLFGGWNEQRKKSMWM